MEQERNAAAKAFAILLPVLAIRTRLTGIEKAAWNRIRNLIWTRRLCCLKADFAVSFNWISWIAKEWKSGTRGDWNGLSLAS